VLYQVELKDLEGEQQQSVCIVVHLFFFIVVGMFLISCVLLSSCTVIMSYSYICAGESGAILANKQLRC